MNSVNDDAKKSSKESTITDPSILLLRRSKIAKWRASKGSNNKISSVPDRTQNLATLSNDKDTNNDSVTVTIDENTDNIRKNVQNTQVIKGTNAIQLAVRQRQEERFQKLHSYTKTQKTVSTPEIRLNENKPEGRASTTTKIQNPKYNHAANQNKQTSKDTDKTDVGRTGVRRASSLPNMLQESEEVKHQKYERSSSSSKKDTSSSVKSAPPRENKPDPKKTPPREYLKTRNLARSVIQQSATAKLDHDQRQIRRMSSDSISSYRNHRKNSTILHLTDSNEEHDSKKNDSSIGSIDTKKHSNKNDASIGTDTQKHETTIESMQDRKAAFIARLAEQQSSPMRQKGNSIQTEQMNLKDNKVTEKQQGRINKLQINQVKTGTMSIRKNVVALNVSTSTPSIATTTTKSLTPSKKSRASVVAQFKLASKIADSQSPLGGKSNAASSRHQESDLNIQTQKDTNVKNFKAKEEMKDPTTSKNVKSHLTSNMFASRVLRTDSKNSSVCSMDVNDNHNFHATSGDTDTPKVKELDSSKSRSDSKADTRTKLSVGSKHISRITQRALLRSAQVTPKKEARHPKMSINSSSAKEGFLGRMTSSDMNVNDDAKNRWNEDKHINALEGEVVGAESYDSVSFLASKDSSLSEFRSFEANCEASGNTKHSTGSNADNTFTYNAFLHQQELRFYAQIVQQSSSELENQNSNEADTLSSYFAVGQLHSSEQHTNLAKNEFSFDSAFVSYEEGNQPSASDEGTLDRSPSADYDVDGMTSTHSEFVNNEYIKAQTADSQTLVVVVENDASIADSGAVAAQSPPIQKTEHGLEMMPNITNQEMFLENNYVDSLHDTDRLDTDAAPLCELTPLLLNSDDAVETNELSQSKDVESNDLRDGVLRNSQTQQQTHNENLTSSIKDEQKMDDDSTILSSSSCTDNLVSSSAPNSISKETFFNGLSEVGHNDGTKCFLVAQQDSKSHALRIITESQNVDNLSEIDQGAPSDEEREQEGSQTIAVLNFLDQYTSLNDMIHHASSLDSTKSESAGSCDSTSDRVDSMSPHIPLNEISRNDQLPNPELIDQNTCITPLEDALHQFEAHTTSAEIPIRLGSLTKNANVDAEDTQNFTVPEDLTDTRSKLEVDTILKYSSDMNSIVDATDNPVKSLDFRPFETEQRDRAIITDGAWDVHKVQFNEFQGKNEIKNGPDEVDLWMVETVTTSDIVIDFLNAQLKGEEKKETVEEYDAVFDPTGWPTQFDSDWEIPQPSRPDHSLSDSSDASDDEVDDDDENLLCLPASDDLFSKHERLKSYQTNASDDSSKDDSASAKFSESDSDSANGDEVDYVSQESDTDDEEFPISGCSKSSSFECAEGKQSHSFVNNPAQVHVQIQVETDSLPTVGCEISSQNRHAITSSLDENICSDAKLLVDFHSEKYFSDSVTVNGHPVEYLSQESETGEEYPMSGGSGSRSFECVEEKQSHSFIGTPAQVQIESDFSPKFDNDISSQQKTANASCFDDKLCSNSILVVPVDSYAVEYDTEKCAPESISVNGHPVEYLSQESETGEEYPMSGGSRSRSFEYVEEKQSHSFIDTPAQVQVEEDFLPSFEGEISSQHKTANVSCLDEKSCSDSKYVVPADSSSTEHPTGKHCSSTEYESRKVNNAIDTEYANSFFREAEEGQTCDEQAQPLISNSITAVSQLDTFHLEAPPPPPPSGEKTRRSRKPRKSQSSSISKSIPLIAPIPKEKLEKWNADTLLNAGAAEASTNNPKRSKSKSNTVHDSSKVVVTSMTNAFDVDPFGSSFETNLISIPSKESAIADMAIGINAFDTTISEKVEDEGSDNLRQGPLLMSNEFETLQSIDGTVSIETEMVSKYPTQSQSDPAGSLHHMKLPDHQQPSKTMDLMENLTETFSLQNNIELVITSTSSEQMLTSELVDAENHSTPPQNGSFMASVASTLSQTMNAFSIPPPPATKKIKRNRRSSSGSRMISTPTIESKHEEQIRESKISMPPGDDRPVAVTETATMSRVVCEKLQVSISISETISCETSIIDYIDDLNDDCSYPSSDGHSKSDASTKLPSEQRLPISPIKSVIAFQSRSVRRSASENDKLFIPQPTIRKHSSPSEKKSSANLRSRSSEPSLTRRKRWNIIGQVEENGYDSLESSNSEIKTAQDYLKRIELLNEEMYAIAQRISATYPITINKESMKTLPEAETNVSDIVEISKESMKTPPEAETNFSDIVEKVESTSSCMQEKDENECPTLKFETEETVGGRDPDGITAFCQTESCDPELSTCSALLSATNTDLTETDENDCAFVSGTVSAIEEFANKFESAPHSVDSVLDTKQAVSLIYDNVSSSERCDPELPTSATNSDLTEKMEKNCSFIPGAVSAIEEFVKKFESEPYSVDSVLDSKQAVSLIHDDVSSSERRETSESRVSPRRKPLEHSDKPLSFTTTPTGNLTSVSTTYRYNSVTGRDYSHPLLVAQSASEAADIVLERIALLRIATGKQVARVFSSPLLVESSPMDTTADDHFVEKSADTLDATEGLCQKAQSLHELEQNAPKMEKMKNLVNSKAVILQHPNSTFCPEESSEMLTSNSNLKEATGTEQSVDAEMLALNSLAIESLIAVNALANPLANSQKKDDNIDQLNHRFIATLAGNMNASSTVDSSFPNHEAIEATNKDMQSVASDSCTNVCLADTSIVSACNVQTQTLVEKSQENEQKLSNKIIECKVSEERYYPAEDEALGSKNGTDSILLMPTDIDESHTERHLNEPNRHVDESQNFDNDDYISEELSLLVSVAGKAVLHESDVTDDTLKIRDEGFLTHSTCGDTSNPIVVQEYDSLRINPSISQTNTEEVELVLDGSNDETTAIDDQTKKYFNDSDADKGNNSNITSDGSTAALSNVEISQVMKDASATSSTIDSELQRVLVSSDSAKLCDLANASPHTSVDGQSALCHVTFGSISSEYGTHVIQSLPVQTEVVLSKSVLLNVEDDSNLELVLPAKPSPDESSSGVPSEQTTVAPNIPSQVSSDSDDPLVRTFSAFLATKRQKNDVDEIWNEGGQSFVNDELVRKISCPNSSELVVQDLVYRRYIYPNFQPSPFTAAVQSDPLILSHVLSFLGDPVAVCRFKMLNKSCFSYIDENEYRLLRDAVRAGGMIKNVRPYFWLWVTLEKCCLATTTSTTMCSHEIDDVSNRDASGEDELVQLEKDGKAGKWNYVIERDVPRAFGNLPPHKSGARLRTDSIVRALISWGKNKMKKSGNAERKSTIISDDTSNEGDGSLTPTDTVSDWGGVTPVGSFASDDREMKSGISWTRGVLESDLALNGNGISDEIKFALQQKLSFVLHALAAAHPDVGYCQGMDYVVAHLLRILKESVLWKAANGTLPVSIKCKPWFSSKLDNFNDLSVAYEEIEKSLVVEEVCFRIMDTFFTVYNLQHFYWPELRCLKTCCRVFEKLIQIKLPVLADHFDHHELNVGLFALGWFQTLFLYLPSMPSSTVCHMWDIWLVERSYKIFFRVATAILFLSQPILLNHDLEGMMSYLNTFPDATLLCPDILIACALKIKVTNQMLMELEQEVVNELEGFLAPATPNVAA